MIRGDQDARWIALRRFHEEMDRAVLAAYGWDDLVVPPYGTPGTQAEKLAVARFEDEVIDRLFALNAQRAAAEKAASAAMGTATGEKAKGGEEGGCSGWGWGRQWAGRVGDWVEGRDVAEALGFVHPQNPRQFHRFERGPYVSLETA